MQSTLINISIKFKTIISYCFTNTVIRVLASSWLIVLGAHTIVPFYPVHMTLQTFAIALISLVMPPKIAISSMLCYLSYAVIWG